MNEYIKKYYFYFIDSKNKKTIKEIKAYCKKNKIDFAKLTDKITRSVAKLKFELNGLGYDLSLEGFNKMLEDYLQKKDSLSDKEKKRYLRILVNLSKLYDVDLRAELFKNANHKKIDHQVIKQFIEFHLGPKVNEDNINTLKNIFEKNNISYDALAKKYMPIVNDLKQEAQEINYDTDKDSFKKLIAEYNDKKSNLPEDEKMKYLKIMFKLSKIYDINIKDALTTKKTNVKKIPKINLNISNPLDNEDYLKKLLVERYNSGSFDIHSIHSEYYKESQDNEYDSYQQRLELISYLLTFYLDKISNYALDDINTDYQKLLEEKDIAYLTNLTIDDLSDNIKILLNNKEPNLSKNINILLKKLIEITDYNDNIGTENKNIFHNQSNKSIYTIYLNTSPSKDTFNIINSYIKECLNNNINYDMRPYDSFEKTCLYSSKEDLNLKINILNNILSNYDLTNFATPAEYTGIINNNVYSISNIAINECNYYEFFTELLEVSYYRLLSKIIINKVDNPQDASIIDSFIELSDVTFDGNKIPFNIICHKNTFSTIKDIVHKYIPEVIDTLQKYFNEDKLIDKIYKEFKKSILYIFNIINNFPKTNNSNICVIM